VSGSKKSKPPRVESLPKTSKDSTSVLRKKIRTEMEMMRAAMVQVVLKNPKAKAKKKSPRKARVKKPLLEETMMKMTNRLSRLDQAKLSKNSTSFTKTTT